MILHVNVRIGELRLESFDIIHHVCRVKLELFLCTVKQGIDEELREDEDLMRVALNREVNRHIVKLLSVHICVDIGQFSLVAD